MTISKLLDVCQEEIRIHDEFVKGEFTSPCKHSVHEFGEFLYDVRRILERLQDAKKYEKYMLQDIGCAQTLACNLKCIECRFYARKEDVQDAVVACLGLLSEVDK